MIGAGYLHRVLLCLGCWFVLSHAGHPVLAEAWPGFVLSPHFDEQVRVIHLGEKGDGIRAILIAPNAQQIDPGRPTRLIVFATPNGNTAEQTLGCRMAEGRDWHYDIQHIAAQYRIVRTENQRENQLLACVQPDVLSWPRWRSQRPDNAQRIHSLIQKLCELIPIEVSRITLAAHSGGGSFIFGFINGAEQIPDMVDRIVFLDANYSYSDEEKHGNKLLEWLKRTSRNRLIVLAYDDREITYKGKKVVSETGGTYRATHRMIERFKRDARIARDALAGFDRYRAIDGRAIFLIHPNPDNIILHTRMVGEMNGLVYALTADTPEENLSQTLGGPRAYMAYVQPDPVGIERHQPEKSTHPGPTIPPRPDGALGGHALLKTLATLHHADRDRAIREELLRGNVPDFLRRFVAVHVRAKIADDSELSGICYVSPDYLAVGSDDDFVRVPVTPMTAQAVADAFGCTLPTPKLVDEIYLQAAVKLPPLPLTEDRESVTSFLQHNGLIEWQRQGQPLGRLVAGIKKDIVLTNRLSEKPNRVAIYGWHRLNGKPIQPLYVGHVDTYVDYSHGVRLILKTMHVKDEAVSVDSVLSDQKLSNLLSNEGVITHTRY